VQPKPALNLESAAATPSPVQPAGDMTGSLKGPIQRYVVKLKTRIQDLAQTNTAEGDHHLQLEYLLVAFDADGNRLNYSDKGLGVTVKASQYEAVLKYGLPFTGEIDLPQGRVFLRLAVHDLATDRIGSLEVPLIVASKSAH
jgi:hypothetical protein